MNRTIRKIGGLLMVMSFLAISTSCVLAKRIKASGNYITKEINVSDFDAIKLMGSEDVYYTQIPNGKTSVKILASDNIIDLYNIRVENGTLLISRENNVSIFGLGNRGTVKIFVSSPRLKDVSLMGSGDVFLKTAIKADRFNANIMGSGDIKGSGIFSKELSARVQGSGDLKLDNIKSETVEASILGSGDVTLSGESNSAQLETTGSGDLNASNLKSLDVIAETKGSGDVSCFAVNHLKAKILGSGDVSYKGKPSIDFQDNRKLHRID